mmetsp:Transcript_15810/g.43376  ORF Transcript_15810/g.43376 Transcript_15810/m.43376 type:complete len:90 (+) Transcript_15810:672-941(+)
MSHQHALSNACSRTRKTLLQQAQLSLRGGPYIGQVHSAPPPVIIGGGYGGYGGYHGGFYDPYGPSLGLGIGAGFVGGMIMGEMMDECFD